MPGGYKNIDPEDGNQFKKGDERINRKGRPPKLLNQLNEELREKGYEPVTESQIIEAYLLLLNMKKDDILDLIRNGEVPAIFEIAAKGIGQERGLQAVEMLLERAVGKPQNRTELSGDVDFKIKGVDFGD